MLATLEDGGMVEVATVGREGMIGASAVLDNSPPNATTLVHVAEGGVDHVSPGSRHSRRS